MNNEIRCVLLYNKVGQQLNFFVLKKLINIFIKVCFWPHTRTPPSKKPLG